MDDTMRYFNEMNLLQSDVQKRTKTAKKFKHDILLLLKNQFMDLVNGVFLHEKTSQEYRDELMDLYISMATDSTDSEVIWKAKRFSNYIQDATEREVLKQNGNAKYTMSVQFGYPVKKEDIPKSVCEMFGDIRAENIALNETNWIYNYQNHVERVEKGQLNHTWVSMKDEKVRINHFHADGQTVPIGEPFTVGGYKMMFPMDDSLGAPISEIIGCRCIEL